MCSFICCVFGCVWCVAIWPIDPWWWPFDGPEDAGIIVRKSVVGGPVLAQATGPYDGIRPPHAFEKSYSLETARRAHARDEVLADTIQIRAPTLDAPTLDSLPDASLPNLIATQ